MKSIDEQMLEIEKERIDREREAHTTSKKHFRWNLYASTIFILILSAIMFWAQENSADKRQEKILIKEQTFGFIQLSITKDRYQSKIKLAEELLNFEYYHPEVEKTIKAMLSFWKMAVEPSIIIIEDEKSKISSYEMDLNDGNKEKSKTSSLYMKMVSNDGATRTSNKKTRAKINPNIKSSREELKKAKKELKKAEEGVNKIINSFLYKSRSKHK